VNAEADALPVPAGAAARGDAEGVAGGESAWDRRARGSRLCL